MDFEEQESRRGVTERDAISPDTCQNLAVSIGVEAAYKAHGPELARYIRRRVQPQDVGDLVQECFRRFAQRRRAATGLIDRPAAYLVQTARNLLAENARTDARRLQAGHSPYEDEAHAGPDPHAALEARDAIRRLEEVIARLKPKTRAIFLMHRIEGLSYDEIAAAQGMSVKGVEKQMAKALGAIRRSRQDHR